MTETNEFKPFTDKLAETLAEKNKAYGDSFTKTVKTYGLSVIGIRLMDKYNRIEHLITNDEQSENGESLKDNLLDIAGYSILALRYLHNTPIVEEKFVDGKVPTLKVEGTNVADAVAGKERN